MPIKMRDLAQESLLLLAAVSLLCLGAAGLTLNLWERHYALVANVLVPDAALSAMLFGAGLLASMQGWRWVRCGVMSMLLLLLLYTLVHNVVAGGVTSSWITQGRRMASLSTLAMLPAAVSLLLGLTTRWHQRLWRLSGVLLWIFGLLALSVLSSLWLQAALRVDMLATSSPFVVVFFAFLLGMAMLLASQRESEKALNLGSLTMAACVGGVALSSLAWLVLSQQQHANTQQRASYLLDNIQLNVEQVVEAKSRLMERMAARLEAAETQFDPVVMAQDAHNYLRDTPSIEVMTLLSATTQQQEWTFERSPAQTRWLEAQLSRDAIKAWLNVPFEQPQLLLPDANRPAAALLLIHLPDHNQQLVTVFDLETLLQSELSLELGPFHVGVIRQDESLFFLPSSDMANDTDSALYYPLASQTVALPGGNNLALEAYPGSHHNWQAATFVPMGITFGGLTLSWLLAFSLGAVSLTSARSRELAEARQMLEDQQRTQRMIAQDAPLESILETICQMLERQLPGAICSVMLADAEKTHLHLAAGARLPASYRKAMTSIHIGIDSGACGSAAFLQELVVCADIANDDRWQGYQNIALKNGLSACWSSPVLGSNGQLLGTFAIYYLSVAEPDKTHQVLIEKAAGLVALVVERAQVRRSLQESEQRYRSLVVHNPDAVFSLDLDGRFVSANATCGAITGYTPDDMLGRSFVDFIQPDDIERLMLIFNDAKQGHIERHELMLHDRDGQAHVIAMINTPIIVNGEIEGIYGIGQDVTASRRQQTRLRTLERSVEASVNGIVIADAMQPDQPIIYANSAFSHMTGYTQDEIIGRNCRFLQGEESDPKVVSRIQTHVKAQRDIHVTLCNYRKDGTLFWNDLYIAPVRDDAGHVTHFVGVQHDITEHKAFEARLAYQASHDALTHLPNRSLFEERLLAEFTASQRRGKQVVVLFVDLDDFKPINDNLGHAVGDLLLVEVAQRLLSAVRPQDTVARLGGDEFVILQTRIGDDTDVMGVVERMLPSLAQPYSVDGQELYLTASIGIAMSQPGTLHPQALIQQADMAMYQAKQQGRNAYHWFNHTLTDSVSERMVLRNDLQEAIDHDAFELYYQPLINRDGRLSGVEALLRWPHPEKGFISPARFIPLAEATGQIMPISEWVLMRACRDMQALSDQGYGAVKIAVNVSPLQFHRTSFLATLRATLDATGLPAEQLELELTEGILLDNTEAAIDTLHALRSMHIPVAIDDFGTGFSSLSYLKNLPISTVKIDRSFIKELPHSEDDAAIVQGIISMAHHLGLNVVAEGIETPPQHVRLLDYQCDTFQGFGLAKPMPLDKLKRFLQDLKHAPITPDIQVP
ncbi:EAL domain-containing protein [Halomonas llamarensis]|uniref:EAL domain-containing protein n=1 Tax=Halomonas llamarensis TaxID=2945104 RepID=A0ABT0SQC6_9GAMM|nr:EAL domain-containing protein [Halomonas llamarensis]MCL7929996.1 EAL domain-containing protein [Halomonas llamarensis]